MSKILYHPCFDQPKVINPRSRGAKKGCINLQLERRAREIGRPIIKTVGPASLKTPSNANANLENWIKEARTYLIRVETVLQIRGMMTRGSK